MKYTADELAVIALDSILGLEYKHKMKILEAVKRPSDLLNGATDVVFDVLDDSKARTVANAFGKDYTDYVVEKLEKRATKAITCYSEGYPDEFENCYLPPICVYCNGNVNLLYEEHKFSIVGSRKSPTDISAITTEYASALAEAGACVVTGSAGGGDTAAIKGALPTGKVVSILAGGINKVYPEYNKRLIESVEKDALVISEQPPDYEVKPWLFPMRNRLIAALGKGVLITSGKYDGGARHTAAFALDQGKEVFAFPYPPKATYGQLCNSLIKTSGAALCDDVNDILSFLGLNSEKGKPELTDETEKRVYELIKEGVDNADIILKELSMKSFELAPVLTSLELQGYIAKDAGNNYKAI